MGASICTEYATKLALANVEFPEFTIDPMFYHYLYHDAKEHLNAHYLDVRDTLSPMQLAEFDRTLQSTFRNSSTVAFGSVGVVALALSLFFDVVGTQLRLGTTNGTNDPILQIFQTEEEEDTNLGVIISEYLRMVPQAANSPERMKNMTELYERRLREALVNHSLNLHATAKTAENYTRTEALKPFLHGIFFHGHLQVHLIRIQGNVETRSPMYLEKNNEFLSNAVINSIQQSVETFFKDHRLTELKYTTKDMSACFDSFKTSNDGGATDAGTIQLVSSWKALRSTFILASFAFFDYEKQIDDFILTY